MIRLFKVLMEKASSNLPHVKVIMIIYGLVTTRWLCNREVIMTAVIRQSKSNANRKKQI